MPRRRAMSESPTLVCVGNLTIDEAVSAGGQRVESIGGDALFAALAAKVAGGDPNILSHPPPPGGSPPRPRCWRRPNLPARTPKRYRGATCARCETSFAMTAPAAG